MMPTHVLNKNDANGHAKVEGENHRPLKNVGARKVFIPKKDHTNCLSVLND